MSETFQAMRLFQGIAASKKLSFEKPRLFRSCSNMAASWPVLTNQPVSLLHGRRCKGDYDWLKKTSMVFLPSGKIIELYSVWSEVPATCRGCRVSMSVATYCDQHKALSSLETYVCGLSKCTSCTVRTYWFSLLRSRSNVHKLKFLCTSNLKQKEAKST